jgi:WD40 repeat protein
MKLDTLLSDNETGHSAMTPTRSDASGHLIITVHGIRTFGKWQERLETLVHKAVPTEAITFCHYKFGYFSLAAFLIPLFRWLVVRHFREELKLLATRHAYGRIDLVGHSFGTHIIAWALFGLRPQDEIKIHTVILSGSVLRAGFAWSQLIGTRVLRVVNDCGTRDSVLLLSQFLVLFTGMAGRTGFSGMTSDKFRNRYSSFGHSGYFQDTNSLATDDYMRDNWVPLLTTSKPINYFNQIREGGVLRGLAAWASNNAEPIKLTVYLGPVLAFGLWIGTQVQEVAHQRAAAEIARKNENQQRQIANEQAHLAALEAENAKSQQQIAQDRKTDLLAAMASDYSSKADYATALGISLYASSSAAPGALRPNEGVLYKSILNALANLVELKTLEHRIDKTLTARLHPSRNVYIVSYNRDKRIEFKSLADGSLIKYVPCSNCDISEQAFDRVGDLFATELGTSDDEIGVGALYQIFGTEQFKAFRGHKSWINSISLSQSGRRIATVADDNTVKVWSSLSGIPIFSLPVAPRASVGFVRLTNGIAVLTGNELSIIEVKNGESENTKLKVAIPYTSHSLAFCGNRSMVLALPYLGSIITGISIDSNKAVSFDAKTTASVVGVDCDEHQLVISYSDGVVGSFSLSGKLWNSRHIFSEVGTAVTSKIALSPDGTQIAVSSGKLFKIIRATGLRTISVAAGHDETITSLSYSYDGKVILSASEDGTIRTWRAKTGEGEGFTTALTTSNVIARGIHGSLVTIGSDGRFVVSSDDPTHSCTLGNPAQYFYRPRGAFSAEEKYVAIFSEIPDNLKSSIAAQLRVYSVQECELISTENYAWGSFARPADVRELIYTSGSILFASSRLDKILVESAKTGEQAATLAGHSSHITATALSPDGSLLATSDSDTVRLWSVPTWNLITEFSAISEIGKLEKLAFSDDGKWLVAFSSSGQRIKVQRTIYSETDLVTAARAALPRPLSSALQAMMSQN